MLLPWVWEGYWTVWSRSWGVCQVQVIFSWLALVMLTLSSLMGRSFHSIWLICCSSSCWSLIHWTSSLCLTSCSSMFCQNFFPSPMSQSGWSSFLAPCRISWHLPWTSDSVCTAHFFWYIFWIFVLWLVVSALDPLCRLWAAYLLLSCVSWGWSWVSFLSCWWCFHWCIQWWWIWLLLVGLFVSGVFIARLVVCLLASYWLLVLVVLSYWLLVRQLYIASGWWL